MSKDYHKEYYKANKEKYVTKAKNWKNKNKLQFKQIQKKYKINNKKKIKKSQQNYNSSVKRQEWKKSLEGKRLLFQWDLKCRYGLSIEEYAWLFYNQKELCPICSCRLDLTEQKTVFVDHDHVTGVVRGLVHRDCNFLIGLVEKLGSQTVHSIVMYLQK